RAPAWQIYICGERPPAQAEPVPGWIMNELRRGEAGRVDRADLAVCPALHGALGHIVNIDVAGRPGRFVGESELLAGIIEAEALDASVLQSGRVELQIPQRIDNGKPALAIDVHHIRTAVTARADRKRLHIPGNVGRNPPGRMGAGIVIAKLLEVALSVGDQVETNTIRRKARGGDTGLGYCHR